MYKSLSILIISTILFSCVRKDNKAESNNIEQSFIGYNDSIYIRIDSFIRIFSKQEFKLITDSFPQLKGIYGLVEHPDSTYFKYPFFVDGYTFGSEAGQDDFYILYAYFLRERNDSKEIDKRDNLIKIYRNLNEIYGELNRGGTYFGHQYIRIVGYAEYDIYNSSLEGVNRNIKDFHKEKQDFLKSIEKDIDKTVEELHDFRTGLTSADLLQYVKQLNNLLSDEFYLSRAKEFKKTYYNF